MQNHKFQIVVIGSGPGGYVAAIRAAQLGFKVACIEKNATVGGTCLNVGCIPSKALLESSQFYYHLLKSSKEQGVNVQGVSFELDAMMKRKEGIVNLLVNGVASHLKKHGVLRIEGSAKFLTPYEIEVNGKRYSTEHVIIATGSEPIAFPFLPFDEERIVSSTGALSLKKVPNKLLVIGGGAIGIELASVYRRLGSEVKIIEMLNVIASTMDLSLSNQLLQSLKRQGIECLLEAKVTGAEILKESVKLFVEHEQKILKLDADVVLLSVGRKPFTQGLNLEGADVQLTPKGFISVDRNFKTSQPNIYAIGDVIEGPMLAHKASHEGIATAELIAGMQPVLNYLSIPNIIYTHPEVASVGLTETEAVAAGFDLMVGISFFRGNARARCSGDFEGFVKVIGHKKSGALLGMHIMGNHASELIAEGMLALNKKATIADIAHSCHAHPTLSEAIMEACQQALGYPIHG